MLGITDLTLDFLTGQPFLTALFLIFLLLFSVYLYRRTNPPLSRPIRLLLTSLRIIAVAALFLALFEPVLSYRREYQRKPKLTLLIDRSKSMDIIEGNKSRADRVDSLLSSDRFRAFARNFDITITPFAGNIADYPQDLRTDQTALGDVIRSLSGREMAAPSEGWLLLSDGISNSGMAPIEAASDLKTPIYAVGLGTMTSDRDVAIERVEYNQTVFAGKPTETTVHLRWQGMNNDKVTVRIFSGRRELVAKSIKLAAGMLKDEINLKLTPQKPGQQTFRVTVDGVADETSDDNNHRSISMTVMKSKMKVLLVSDRVDLEYSFLNRRLSQSESVELTQVVSKKGGGYLTGAFPSSQSELNRYDLIILYDINLNSLKSKEPLLGSYLNDKGGAVFALLGDNYLSSSSPRWLDKYLPFVSTHNNNRLVYIKFNGRPSENYLLHPAVRISDSRQGVREAWRSLPHFEALVPLDSMTPHSEVLVMAEISGGQSDYPILAFRRVGAGRVLASSALPYWHWAFFGYGFGDDDREYRLFTDGIVNWLSLKEEADPIRIMPDKKIYTRGENVGFNASVFDLGFRPITGADGQVTLVNEDQGDSTVIQFIEKGEGRYRADGESLPPGRYQYFGLMEKDGRKFRETSGRIVIETFSIEEYQRRPDFEQLAELSRKNGGNFYTINEVDSLFPLIDKKEISVSLSKEIIIWNKLWLLIIFIAALSLEWFIRKRYQLI